jgi:hypothetical protein
MRLPQPRDLNPWSGWVKRLRLVAKPATLKELNGSEKKAIVDDDADGVSNPKWHADMKTLGPRLVPLLESLLPIHTPAV